MARKIAYEEAYLNITFVIRSGASRRHVLAKFAGRSARRCGIIRKMGLKRRSGCMQSSPDAPQMLRRIFFVLWYENSLSLLGEGKYDRRKCMKVVMRLK